MQKLGKETIGQKRTNKESEVFMIVRGNAILIFDNQEDTSTREDKAKKKKGSLGKRVFHCTWSHWIAYRFP